MRIRRLISHTPRYVSTINKRAITTTAMPDFHNMGVEFASHEELHRYSIQEPEKFWSTLARSNLRWSQDFHTGMDCNFDEGISKWFLGGKLNVADNCIDRWAEMDPNRTAFIWEKDNPGEEEYISYSDLKSMVCKMANLFKQAGVEKGDVIGIYLPVSPVAVATMLAAARIGAMHNVIFAGFSSDSLATRLTDSRAKVLVTADQIRRGGKVHCLKSTVDEAMKNSPHVQHVFIDGEISGGHDDRFKCLSDALAGCSTDCEAVQVESEDPLFLLYTSGSTGKPKGLCHSSAGYLLYALVTMKCAFDYKEGEVFGCVADIGWITGHSYVVYGPLANGGTSVLFGSTPTYPDPGRYWETVERLKINHLYTAPTAYRLLFGHGGEYAIKYDISSIRKFGSVGEPLNQETWNWLYEKIGEKRRDIIDTWWQTETGGVALAPRPSAPSAPLSPGKPQRPMFGMNPVLMDSKGNKLTGNDVEGALCLATPWPGMARTIFGDPSRLKEAYFKQYPGMYFTGDGAIRDANGDYKITGRMDDVINVSGHRLGTAEVEDCLSQHPSVAEAAVVGFPHNLKGEGIYAFVILKQDVEIDDATITDELKKTVKTRLTGFAVPDRIMITPGLPKTRSGKILRRVLKKIADSKFDDLGDLTTLADPSAVDVIVQKHKLLMTGSS